LPTLSTLINKMSAQKKGLWGGGPDCTKPLHSLQRGSRKARAPRKNWILGHTRKTYGGVVKRVLRNTKVASKRRLKGGNIESFSENRYRERGKNQNGAIICCRRDKRRKQ